MNSLAVVRAETPDDRPHIRSINEAAFGHADEAGLVECLHAEGTVLLSLVAEADGRPAGHILFSRMWIDTAEGSVEAAALAPVSVLPDFQNRGLDGRLIRRGLDLLRERGERIAIVLGHPGY